MKDTENTKSKEKDVTSVLFVPLLFLIFCAGRGKMGHALWERGTGDPPGNVAGNCFEFQAEIFGCAWPAPRGAAC